MKRQALMLLFAAGTPLALAPQAQATILVRDAMGGESPFGNNEYYFFGTSGVIFAGASGDAIQKTLTGTFDFEISYDGGTFWGDLTTFCLEPLQDLAFDPAPSDQDGELYKEELLMNLGFTAFEENALEIIWDNGLDDTLLSDVNAAAMQSIIWELKQDDAFDLSDGLFRLSNSDAFTISVQAKAEEWWANVGGVWTTKTNLLALASPTSQDLLTVPEPGVITLSIFGGLSMFRMRRRSN